MANPTIAAISCSAALLLGACGGPETAAAPPPQAAAGDRAPEPAPRPRARNVENCSTRSEASFAGTFTNPDNVVAGPFVLVGAAHTAASTIREFGGDKFHVLVRPGHRVTVAVSWRTWPVAALGYGRLPEGVELQPRDGHRVVEFIACEPGGPSESTAAGQPVTFWSGFVLTRTPGCVRLELWIDGERSPRRVALPMGVWRC